MRDSIVRRTVFTARLESDLIRAILDLLQRHAMQELTVSDLCEFASYPRSTFYKYYYDLEDLFTDYLFQVWDAVGFEARDDFYQMARRLYQYQTSHRECASVFSVNQNSSMFRSYFAKVLRSELMRHPFMAVAVRQSSFPSRPFIADYVLRSIELLGAYEKDMTQRELELTAARLLFKPFSKPAVR